MKKAIITKKVAADTNINIVKLDGINFETILSFANHYFYSDNWTARNLDLNYLMRVYFNRVSVNITEKTETYIFAKLDEKGASVLETFKVDYKSDGSVKVTLCFYE